MSETETEPIPVHGVGGRYRVTTLDTAMGLTMDTDEGDWIETRAVARHLGVTQEAAKNWPRARSFPREAAKKDGKRILWHLPTVRQWREWRLEQ